MSSIAYSQVYGFGADDQMTATAPGDGESASTFDIAEYAIPDRTPALSLVAILVVFIVVRVLWEKAA